MSQVEVLEWLSARRGVPATLEDMQKDDDSGDCGDCGDYGDCDDLLQSQNHGEFLGVGLRIDIALGKRNLSLIDSMKLERWEE